MQRMRTLDEYLLKRLHNKKEAQSFLQIACEQFKQDKDTKAFLSALKLVAEAQGGMTKLAHNAHLSREHLYRTLSPKGNPRFTTLLSVCDALGINFYFSLAPHS